MAKGTPNRLLTDALREIRHTRSRFLSLLILSALAVCFLAGLRATAPDMKLSADRYFDDRKLMDLRVVSTLGLTDQDLSALAARDGVETAEGAYTVDAILHQENNDYIVKVLSLTDGVNLPQLKEGRLPRTDGEVLVEPRFLQETGLKIGDAITLDTGDGDFEGALIPQSFTIVGTADTPLYIGVERGSSSLGTGKVSAYVLAPRGAFDLEYYTDAYLRLAGAAELETYSQAYEDFLEGSVRDLEDLGEERAPLRRQEVLDEANEALADAQRELDDARAEADQELADAWAELTDGRAELDQGWADYRDGLKEYEDGRRELDTQVADARKEIADGEAELADALTELQDGEAELADGRAELDQGWTDYYQGWEDYADGLREYQEGQEEYDRGYQEYLDGKEAYQDGVKAYQRGKNQLADAARELNAGEAAYTQGKGRFDGLVNTILEQTGLPMTAQELLAALRAEEGAGPVTGAVDAVLSGMTGQLDQGIAQGQAQLAELEGQLEQANQAIETLPILIQGLEEQIAAAGEEDTSALEAELAQCKAQLAQAQAALPALEEGVAQTRAAIQSLEEQRAAIPEDSAALLAAADVLDQSRAQLDQGWSEYHAGQAKLRRAKEQLAEAEAELADAEKEIKAGKAELMKAQYQLTDARAQLEEALADLQEGEADYADGRKELDDGWAEYNDGLAELADAKETLARETAEAEEELADAKVKLADALRELEEGEADYADGLADYEEGKAEADEKIFDAQEELDQARREVEEIEECQWYVLDRNTNMGYVSYSMDADRMGSLADVFPLIFFLVAALVCLTTMTRMVEEQRVAIGGMKALGYTRGAIAVKYVGYGFLASALGALVGLAVGLTLLPWIICTAWGIIYATGDIYYSLEPLTSAAACLAAVGTVTLAAWGACASALRAVPAQLMRPKAPPTGKRILLERIGPLWRRLSFNHKVTLRNLFRYQKRFWMTVAGIGGCAALIVTAFGLRDSIFDVMDRQYDELYYYTAQVGLVDKVTAGELRQVEETLEGAGMVRDWMPCRSESVTALTQVYTVDAVLQTADSQESLSRFVNLRHRTGKEPVVLPDDGVVLTEKLAKLLDVEPGDTFTLDGEKRVEVRVADVTEHYIRHYIYMTDAYYQTLFGQAPAHNLVLADYPAQGEEAQELAADLVALDGVTSLSLIADTRSTFTSSLESVDYAVILIIVCAAALAFVVLYNLTNINITERMRELATLKVLGFYDGELSAYVYRENVILTVLGVAMGMVMGKLLHQWLILTVEIDMLMFGRTLRPASYDWAVLLTVIFSLLVNLSAHWKLKKLDMVESLKSVE